MSGGGECIRRRKFRMNIYSSLSIKGLRLLLFAEEIQRKGEGLNLLSGNYFLCRQPYYLPSKTPR